MPNRYKSFSTEAESYEAYNNVTIFRMPVREHKNGFIEQSLTFYEYSKQVLHLSKKIEFDLVVATTSRFMTGVLGTYISKKYKCKYFIDIRDVFSETLTELFRRKRKLISYAIAPVLLFLEKYMLKQADKVNIVSEGFREYFSNRGFDTSHWLFIPNGIDAEFVSNQFEQKKNKNNKIQVVYAGNIGDGQGLDCILPEAANILKETHEFCIIGDGRAREALANKINSIGVNNIKILKPVDRNILIKYYKEADILFLHLNDFKAFRRVLPSKVFEYAAIGKPIVAGVSGYSSEFLTKHVPYANIFNPCDIDGCVNALRDAENICVSNQSRQDFINSFRRDNISEQLADAILNL